ncbi:MAG TPA: glycosyltransferase family 4 protein [Terriglobales bacterium]|nr:glycosyltransferase family 4 protein [Terriglobales bacterium]
MKTKLPTPPITIFTPSFADEDNTNAQNLTVKEIVARLCPEQFRVVMISEGKPDPRIAARRNTKLLPYYKHGNTAQLLMRSLAFRPDIYFFPRFGPLDQAVFGLRKRLGLRTALVTYIVMAMNGATANGLVARSALEGDAVLANSGYVAETVWQQFGIRAGTIYDGIDRRFFFPGNEPGSAKARVARTVLYAGSFQPRKRVEVMIQQAARWPDVIFRLAGRGVTEPSCRALVAQLGCKNVVFLGHLTSAQLGDEMRRADVFFFPSILEGHPQVLGQAAACGLPAIAMNVYQPEYVLHEKTGFLAESDTELAQKLDLLLCDSATRQSMSWAAAQHSQTFNWDRIAEQWTEVFRQVAAERLNS